MRMKMKRRWEMMMMIIRVWLLFLERMMRELMRKKIFQMCMPDRKG
jgi:hypothetical protein